MPSCKEAARLSSESLERKLSLRERLLLWLHGRVCYYCTRYSSQIGWMHKACRSDDHYEYNAEESLPDERKEKLRSLLEQQGKGSGKDA